MWRRRVLLTVILALAAGGLTACSPGTGGIIGITLLGDQPTVLIAVCGKPVTAVWLSHTDPAGEEVDDPDRRPDEPLTDTVVALRLGVAEPGWNAERAPSALDHHTEYRVTAHTEDPITNTDIRFRVDLFRGLPPGSVYLGDPYELPGLEVVTVADFVALADRYCRREG